MFSGRYRLFLWAAPLILLGCLLLRYSNYQNPSNTIDALVVGCLFGTMFAQTTVASAWAVFGPGPLIWRWPLSLIWIAILVGAWAINHLTQHNGSNGAAAVMGANLLVQWILVQIPLWVVALVWGIRLRHPDEPGRTHGQSGAQFSLRHLLVLMAIIGIGLTIGRLLVPVVVVGFKRVGEWQIYQALSLAAVVMTLPLLLALLWPHRYLRATALVLIPITLARFWEPAFLRLVGEHLLSELHLDLINGVTVAWILAFTLAVRLSGYRLARPQIDTAPRPAA